MQTAAMPFGKWLLSCACIWEKKGTAILAQCTRPDSSTTSSPAPAVRATSWAAASPADKLSGTGRQGDLMGGGITGGYMWRLNKALSMDFSLGLGYLHADSEKYEVTDGVRVRSGNETKHWIGPINAGVTLVWRLF